MTTRTSIVSLPRDQRTNKTRWISGTRMARKAAPKLPNVSKPYTAPDEATLVQLVECYGYLMERENSWMWLTNLVPKYQREIVADRIRAKLKAARAEGQPGKTIVSTA